MTTSASNAGRPQASFGESVPLLAAAEFQQIRELAYRTFGLDLKPGKEELVSARLRRLLREGGFGSFQEYFRHVRADNTGEALNHMVDALTTNHTSFLRESDHFDFFRTRVLPILAERESIEIWSAGCATGEEVWTLGCILNDVLPNRRLRIVGTDISGRALRFAQRGVYPTDRCGGIPRDWLARYFERTVEPAPSYRVRDSIRSQAVFRRLNLVRPFSWPHAFPVIFCRNVMIYFDSQTQEALIGQLSAALEPGGHLFVGHAESLARIRHSLEYVQPAVYRKPSGRAGKWIKSS